MGKKILIVDDEMVMRSLIAIAMQRSGYSVMDADNSFQALDCLDSTTPDLIILDIMMPGMNGIDLCRRIRSRPGTTNTPIIVFSALGDDKTINTALDAGADEYLHKLSLFGELVAMVNHRLSEPAAGHSYHHQSRRHIPASAVGKPAV